MNELQAKLKDAKRRLRYAEAKYRINPNPNTEMLVSLSLLGINIIEQRIEAKRKRNEK